ncbi:MAG TPA: G1 family glutamic endopeptidase [Actinospica sp.]|nr:G1 family glutamic endopeptidase [Actinospica sp.]
MSFKRSPLRAGIAAAALVLPALAPVAAAATAAPTVFAPIQRAAGSATPFFISHGGGVRNADTTSTNWAGYAANGSTYTSVTTTFKQPKVTCSSGTEYSSFWVGLDGYSSSSVEQTGTEADCSGTSASYSAWYEMYPNNPVTYSNTVAAGDTIVEKVIYEGSNKYELYLADSTRGWSHTTTKTGSFSRSSAEVIAEAPYSGGVLPLANFGTVTFTGSTVDGSSLSSSSPTSINMTTSSGTVKASTGTLSGGTFAITWKHK